MMSPPDTYQCFRVHNFNSLHFKTLNIQLSQLFSLSVLFFLFYLYLWSIFKGERRLGVDFLDEWLKQHNQSITNTTQHSTCCSFETEDRFWMTLQLDSLSCLCSAQLQETVCMRLSFLSTYLSTLLTYLWLMIQSVFTKTSHLPFFQKVCRVHELSKSVCRASVWSYWAQIWWWTICVYCRQA